jgi:hypothetical protein
VAYIRFDWANVEPQEGQCNWKFIDDVISAWKPRGAGVAMRVMTANAHSGGYYSSPNGSQGWREGAVKNSVRNAK